MAIIPGVVCKDAGEVWKDDKGCLKTCSTYLGKAERKVNFYF